MMGSRKVAAATVSELLDIQNAALLTGDLDVLAKMAPELERAFIKLAREKASADQLAQIKESAARNARLLLASQAGVSAARARLTTARAPTLTTYGADGRSQSDTSVASHTSLRR
ncbi:hypothetical protein [Jannaschia sp. CCS1]|uniref:hypothetical protein n=1 Tax=Jannaschia sp. (strain CCS1) TaxID=290400 RepID=UPI000053DBCA|nr:hypothetical protein [Jannaschia sp. CCS1]ABD57121.1 hypothetical protein Jann_4204 [Jannaschia sp. CCS1]